MHGKLLWIFNFIKIFNNIPAGCLLVKEKRYMEACKKFTAAMNVKGYQAHLSYNIALCHYYMKQYALALKNIADIIERGIRYSNLLYQFKYFTNTYLY